MENDNGIGEWNPYEDALDTYDRSVGARVSGDIEEAGRLLRISAEMGWHEAEYDLAIQLLDEESSSVSTNLELREKAIKLLESASLWNQRARQKLQEISIEGKFGKHLDFSGKRDLEYGPDFSYTTRVELSVSNGLIDVLAETHFDRDPEDGESLQFSERLKANVIIADADDSLKAEILSAINKTENSEISWFSLFDKLADRISSFQIAEFSKSHGLEEIYMTGSHENFSREQHQYLSVKETGAEFEEDGYILSFYLDERNFDQRIVDPSTFSTFFSDLGFASKGDFLRSHIASKINFDEIKEWFVKNSPQTGE